MSHFSRVKTVFRHRDVLVHCLQEMGYTIETDTEIQGYHGLHTVDIAARRSSGYALGFVKNADGTFDLIADWYGVAGKKERQVAEDLKKQAGSLQKEYAKQMVLEQAKKDGFEVVTETEESDGSVRIVVRRWK